jgi:c-di-GMP phosphodiesterase Gmr
VENPDLIPEAPTPLIDVNRLQAEWAKANVATLAALLNLRDDDNSFQQLFRALHAALAFDRALVLDDVGVGLHCLAADPAILAGRRWPDKSLPHTLYLRLAAAGGDRGARDFQDVLAELAAPDESVLWMSVGVSGRPALLLLVRAGAGQDFTESDIAFAKQCEVVALAKLVVHKGAQLEAENQRLKGIVEQSPKENSHLLKEIIDQLPLSLTVQDDAGRFILANTTAVANLGIPASALIGAYPADFLTEQEAVSRREWEQDLLRQKKTVSVETIVSDQTGERTWMTSHKPAYIFDRTLLISSSIDITTHRQVERELAERSHRDKLTWLPDRILVQEHVDAIIREYGNSRRFALAFIDLDNFKQINDYYNHAVGDALLVKISQRITSGLRPGDVLARISGDEFLLLLDPLESEEHIASVIDGVLQSVKQPFQIEAFEIFSSCSIGVSIYPKHGRDYGTLCRNADSAMSCAKQEAKGNAIFFDINVAQAVAARTQAEQRLRLAIRDRKFCCAFQPKVDIHSQQVVGFEALVRWRDDAGEIHPPAEFVGLAVELGLINPITHFVLDETVSSIDRLDATFGPDTTISINVPAKQANDVNFMRSFARALSDSNRANRIIIELTEEAFIGKGMFQTQSLPMLREIGVRISIDDFGTGYSSLSALADITADEIKVDRSFISGIHGRPRNQSILRAIDSLARTLDMSIVAEGVETFEELAYLQTATRIRYAQGFYFAKPFYLENLGDTPDFIGHGREAGRKQPEAHGRTASRLLVPTRSSG